MDRTERNALVEEAMPLARIIASDYIRRYRLAGLRDEIEADAFFALIDLAENFRPGRSSWRVYVNTRLRFRLIDATRRRLGRVTAITHERCMKVNHPVTIDLVHEETIGLDDPGFAELEVQLTLAGTVGMWPDRLRWIVAQRVEGATLAEIAAVIGVSESRVCQILATVADEVRAALA